MAEGGAVGIMQPQPAIHRVVPAQSAVKSEWILPYDDVRAILLDSKTFHVRDCICRVQQAHLGHPCKLPTRICLSFSSLEGAPTPDDISQAEALALLDKAEEVGLVHTVSNVMQGHRLRLQLLWLLLRHPARHHRVWHRALGGPRRLLCRH